MIDRAVMALQEWIHDVFRIRQFLFGSSWSSRIEGAVGSAVWVVLVILTINDDLDSSGLLLIPGWWR